MGLFTTIGDIFRGGAKKGQEALEDSQQDLLLDVAYDDRKKALGELKRQVATLSKDYDNQVKARDLALTKLEEAKAAAKRFLDAGDEENAIALMDDIEDTLKPEHDMLAQMVAGLDGKVKQAISRVKKEERGLKSFKSRANLTKTKKKINDMNASVSTTDISGSGKAQRAESLLQRMEAAETDKEQQFSKEEELFGEDAAGSTDDLIARSKNIGGSTSAADRFKNL